MAKNSDHLEYDLLWIVYYISIISCILSISLLHIAIVAGYIWLSSGSMCLQPVSLIKESNSGSFMVSLSIAIAVCSEALRFRILSPDFSISNWKFGLRFQTTILENDFPLPSRLSFHILIQHSKFPVIWLYHSFLLYLASMDYFNYYYNKLKTAKESRKSVD